MKAKLHIMKKYFIALILLTVISCQKQQNYLITGNIENVPDSTLIDLFIQYDGMGTRICTDTIINGLFEFSDTLESRPAKMNLSIRDHKNFNGSCYLWVDYTRIEVKGKGKYLSDWTATSNIKEQLAYNTLNSKTKKLAVMTDSLYLIMMNNYSDRELSALIRAKADSINQIRQKIEFELIKQNPNSQSALEKFYQIARLDTSIAKEQIKEVYNRLDTVFRNTLYGEGIASILENNAVPEIGNKMINIDAYDISGKKHSLADYKGKYILLDFWSMACRPCAMAVPELRELNTTFSNSLTIVGFNMETNKKMWLKGTERDSITWVNLSDGKGIFAGASSAYGVKGFPTYILINPDGVIVERWMGFRKGILNDKLKKYMDIIQK